MVDRCRSAVIDESETDQTSSQDRRPCEVVSHTPGHSTLLNINAPLQLGGRSNHKIKYPDGVTWEVGQGRTTRSSTLTASLVKASTDVLKTYTTTDRLVVDSILHLQ